MTAPTCFPFQLLSQSPDSRLAYFKNKIVAHPKLSELYTEVLNAINQPVDASLIMIYGPTGVGKSTLRERLVSELMATASTEPDRNPAHIPVVSLEVASLGAKRFSWTDYYRRALMALDEPLVNAKISYNQRGIKRNAKGELIFSYSASVSNLRQALEQALKYRQPRAFFNDEAQHFNKISGARRLLDQMDTLKSLTSLTDTVHILLGTYELLSLTDLSAQLSRRSLNFHFPRYRADIPQERTAFQNTLLTLQRHLPLPEESDLVQHWRYLYEKSAGCVGVLKNLLLKSLAIALKNEHKTITSETLEQCAKSTRKLLHLVREIKEGEAYLTAREEEAAELQTLLGLPSSTVPTPEQQHLDISRGKTKGRVGKRNPVRDTVGTR